MWHGMSTSHSLPSSHATHLPAEQTLPASQAPPSRGTPVSSHSPTPPLQIHVKTVQSPARGHTAPSTHFEHSPALHVPLSLHGAPSGMFVVRSAPPSHFTSWHGLPSPSGSSVSSFSLFTRPLLSHTKLRQSASTCAPGRREAPARSW